MRRASVSRILYASGSGVYGDIGEIEADEDRGPLVPISTYGASKLAGEALISAYCFMFGISGRAFRFGNVVGPWQTHGVGLDFVRALTTDPTRLAILGDGTQSKSYIHVDDVIDAMLTANDASGEPYQVFNVATGDYITVTEIAELAAEAVGLDPANVRFEYAGGDRGWKGDVPIVRLSIERIRRAGLVAFAHVDRSASRLDAGARRLDPRRAAVTMGAPAIFLDRDGTLIRAPIVDGRPGSIRSDDALELEDGAAEACAALRDAGYLLIMVTNQPEITRGRVSREAVDAIHERLSELLPLDDVRMCPHDDADDCACRKPRPGMLLDAARELDIDLGRSFMVGDRWKDVEAGQRAGCTTVFLDRQYSEPMPVRPDATVRDLGEAAAWILERTDR